MCYSIKKGTNGGKSDAQWSMSIWLFRGSTLDVIRTVQSCLQRKYGPE